MPSKEREKLLLDLVVVRARITWAKGESRRHGATPALLNFIEASIKERRAIAAKLKTARGKVSN
jgi:hypothetical protein